MKEAFKKAIKNIKKDRTDHVQQSIYMAASKNKKAS